MITVKFTSRLRLDVGRERDEVEVKSIAELTALMERRYGEGFTRWLPHCRIFVNGSSTVMLDGPDTALAPGDEVLFLLPVAGG